MIDIFARFGIWTALVAVMGIIGSFAVRSRSWALVVWIPTALLNFYVAAWLALRLAAFGRISGPDAIGVGIAFAILVPLLLGALVGLLLCFFARPRRQGGKPLPGVIGIAVVGLVFLFGNQSDGVVVTLRLTDSQGGPLRGISVAGSNQADGMSAGRFSGTTDENGQITFRWRSTHRIELELHAPLPRSGTLVGIPTWTTINLGRGSAPGEILARRHWQRSLGSSTLNEGTLEAWKADGDFTYTVILPPKGSLAVPEMEAKIRESLLGGLDSGYVCGNSEALACLPLVIQAALNEGAQGGITNPREGLKRLAYILHEIDSACGGMRQVAMNPRSHNLDYIEGEFAWHVNTLRAWCGAPQDAPALAVLKQTDARIAKLVQMLADFAVAEIARDGDVATVWGELRESGRRNTKDILSALVEHPPKTGRQAQQWGFALVPAGERGRRMEGLKSLFASDSPALVLVACDALGNQLESEGGAYVLERLRQIRPLIQDKDMSWRADMFIGMLQEEAARTAAATH